MPNTDQKVELALYQAFAYIASFLHYLPTGFASPLLAFLRIVFVSVLGFAAWIRSFSDSSIGLWLVIGLVMCALLHSYFNRICAYPNRSCKVETVERARLEEQAEMINEKWKNELRISDEKLDSFRRQLFEVTKEKSSLEEQLEQRMQANEIMKANFAKNLNILSDSVESIKNIEEEKRRLEAMIINDQFKKLQDENAVLRSTVEVLSKERRSLAEKHAVAMQENKLLANVKRDLEERLVRIETLENVEKEKLEDVQKIAKRLQSSLTSTKGNLSRVKDTLAA